MRYRIEYAGKRHCDFAQNRPELQEKLRFLTDEVEDIRKIYKSGATDSVFEAYKPYLNRIGRS